MWLTTSGGGSKSFDVGGYGVAHYVTAMCF
jgi:hypothetical protein